MKNTNKYYIRATGTSQQNGKSIKRKSVINYVKKYNFYRTSLVTIYEEIEY